MHIHVRAYPDAKKEAVKNLGEGRFHIYVKEPAADNSANRRIMKIVRGLYPDCIVRMVKGHRSPSKVILVTKKGA